MGRDISSIAGRSVRSVMPAEAVCVASVPSPPSDFSMARGSRQPMPFRPARCTITKADRHLIIGTSARAPTPVGPPIAISRSKASAWSKLGRQLQEVQPGTLVYFPPGIPHRLRAHSGPLDYFELQAWRSFKTDVLSEGALGTQMVLRPRGTGRCAGRMGPKLSKQF